MHLLRISFIAIHVVAVAEAAKVKWTLHKSCYRNREDTADDTDLAINITDAVNTAKNWASRGASKIDETVSFLPGGKDTKDLITPLLGSGDYSTAAKDVRDKFKKIADIDGPVGKDGPAGSMYETSKDWHDLEASKDHHFNFIISCRPEVIDVADPGGLDPRPAKWDVLRKKTIDRAHDFVKFLAQENDPATPDWNSLPTPKVVALTQVDKPSPERDANLKESGRLHVPETITFHPLYIRYLKGTNFGTWTDALFNEVTSPNAPAVFKAKGDAKDPKVDIRPVDGLLNDSYIQTILHEFFHLSYFGGMLDDMTGAYAWANNMAKNNRENPDLLAIIGAVIELRNRDGKKYTVSPEGNVAIV